MTPLIYYYKQFLSLRSVLLFMCSYIILGGNWDKSYLGEKQGSGLASLDM